MHASRSGSSHGPFDCPLCAIQKNGGVTAPSPVSLAADRTVETAPPPECAGPLVERLVRTHPRAPPASLMQPR